MLAPDKYAAKKPGQFAWGQFYWFFVSSIEKAKSMFAER